MTLNERQIEALGWACSAVGGWPRAKASERSWVIRSYRALQRRGLVHEVEGDTQEVRGEVRLHFVATKAGHDLLAAME